MSSKSIFLLALIPLILIFGTQVFLVNDYYTTTRAAWIKESNTIIEEAFRKDITVRNNIFRSLMDESTLVIQPTDPSGDDIAVIDFSNDKSSSVISIIDMAIHKHVRTLVPLNLHQLDSVTATILETRKVNSKFTVNIVNNLTGELIEASKDNWRSSLFLISSERMLIDAENDIALQLHLINPFQVIIKRMGLMLISSLVLLIICLLIVVYLQKILDRQKKLVAFKNEFLGTIAHELKRPVSSLTFNLDCLSMSTTTLDTPQNELLLTNSIRATDELNESINMIVTLSKHEEGMLVLSRDTLDLPQLMEELKQKFIIPRFKNKQVSIQLQAKGSIPPVQGDRQLLSQCFSNLLDNAIKYSGEMVDIIIRFEIIDSMVATTIKDNGFGIPEDKLELVFDKYSRVHLGKTQIKGFGIGLNYVKSIVEKHKGEVRVSSKAGVGSEFSVLLPQ